MDDPCISKIEQVMEIFVHQGTTKSCNLKIFKSQYLSEFLRYGPDFLHVIINFIGFKITFSNMGSHGAPSLISRGWSNPPPAFSPLIGKTDSKLLQDYSNSKIDILEFRIM